MMSREGISFSFCRVKGLLVVEIMMSSVVVFLALLFMSERIWSNMVDNWLESKARSQNLLLGCWHQSQL